MVQFFKRIWRWFWTPSKRIALGAIVLVGFVGGIVFGGGLYTAVKATSSLEFCISCHEMEQVVYPEYQASLHYSNASGVRAVCSDCHVPHEWGPMMIRKIQASGEVWAKILGRIDTPEKFEEHRWTMANRVWDSMLANDSQQCRNCHEYEAMNFELQGRRARVKMQEGHEQGKTCIECHKGVAHKLPQDPNQPERED
ncbi:MAG: NapC/NirT family cytochrome c [Devosiaceae bacterium]|nr:NapC/NirT family cytochrome c [Devosiaceae bacterium]